MNQSLPELQQTRESHQLQQLLNHVVDSVADDVDGAVVHVGGSGHDAVLLVDAHLRGLALHVGGAHDLRGSACIRVGVFVAHLLLSQGDMHSGKGASEEHGGNAAGTNRLLGGVEGVDDAGDAGNHLHLRAGNGEGGQVLRGAKTAGEHHGLWVNETADLHVEFA